MIAQISVSWNEKYEHDGFLFFAQRIVEMLDYMTVDIYRAPLLNTSRLIDEYLRIIREKSLRFYRLMKIFANTIGNMKGRCWCNVLSAIQYS